LLYSLLEMELIEQVHMYIDDWNDCKYPVYSSSLKRMHPICKTSKILSQKNSSLKIQFQKILLAEVKKIGVSEQMIQTTFICPQINMPIDTICFAQVVAFSLVF